MSFDPYHSWLGIPPSEQPPNFYRLLGVVDDEASSEVIQNAADRIVAFLRTKASGQRSRECQRLLNEVARAANCLLDAAAKREYDSNQQGDGYSVHEGRSKKLESQLDVADETVVGEMLAGLDIVDDVGDARESVVEEMLAGIDRPEKIPVPPPPPASTSHRTAAGIDTAMPGPPPVASPPSAELGRSSRMAPNRMELATFTNSIGMKLNRIPAGVFVMGNASSGPLPRHVTLTNSIFMGEFVVTQQQLAMVLQADISHFRGPNNPVDRITWDMATEFCFRLSALPLEQSMNRDYRLPTEAEWEFACRAGSTTAYCFGENPSQLTDFGWFNENSVNSPQPVGQKQPNAWGLHDMHGNVFEWCADWYGELTHGPVVDPQGPPHGSSRVCRGGCWNLPAAACSSTSRSCGDDLRQPGSTGFRVAMLMRD